MFRNLKVSHFRIYRHSLIGAPRPTCCSQLRVALPVSCRCPKTPSQSTSDPGSPFRCSPLSYLTLSSPPRDESDCPEDTKLEVSPGGNSKKQTKPWCRSGGMKGRSVSLTSARLRQHKNGDDEIQRARPLPWLDAASRQLPSCANVTSPSYKVAVSTGGSWS